MEIVHSDNSNPKMMYVGFRKIDYMRTRKILSRVRDGEGSSEGTIDDRRHGSDPMYGDET